MQTLWEMEADVCHHGIFDGCHAETEQPSDEAQGFPVVL